MPMQQRREGLAKVVHLNLVIITRLDSLKNVAVDCNIRSDSGTDSSHLLSCRYDLTSAQMKRPILHVFIT